jgi:GWxTD domain-containing protein
VAPCLDAPRASPVPCRQVPPVTIEADTVRASARHLLTLSLVLSAGCGTWRRVGQPDRESAADRLPQLFEPRNTFREMGLLVDNGPVGFVGSARVVAGPHADTALLLVGLSLPNRGLTFRRDGDAFVADYRVEVTLRREGQIAVRGARDERVRVATFRETQRSDESVIFQQYLPAPAGEYLLDVSVRDRSSPNAGQVSTPVRVPSLRPPSVSLPIPVYEARPRHAVGGVPDLIANPRGAVEFGADTLRFYLETYGLSAGARVELAAVDAAGRTAWQDTVVVDSGGPVRGFLRRVPPGVLSIGRYEIRVSQGDRVLGSAPAVVMFSEQFAVANLEDVVSLLRYFPERDSLRALLAAPPEERAAAWRRFWEATDPNRVTPDNEAVTDYLARLQSANERFNDEGVPGWLTERGEVYITLGEPNEIIDRRAEFQGRGRYVIWNYYELRLVLRFLDDSGFGRYRLDPASRAEYLRVLNRLRGR